jgi:hypothetical protein
MFHNLFIAAHPRRRQRVKAWEEIQIALLRRFIRLNLFLRRFQTRLAPIRGYLWAPPMAFLIGTLIGLVATTLL